MRELLAEAAANGDYDAVLQLTAWARQLRALSAEVGGTGDPSDEDTGAGGGPEHAARNAASAGAPPCQTRKPRKAPKETDGATRTARRRTTYPKFTREGDDLVKTGWSKKGGKEYQHRAPGSIIDLVGVALVDQATDGQPITTAKLLPLEDTSLGTLPDYQVYVCLAWMRHEGLLQTQGRQGYRVVEPSKLRQELRRRWDRLAS